MYVLDTVSLLCAAQVSGVIAVVVFGLYGSATAKWGLSPKVAESGIFDDFWDTVGFAVTGMVFFFSGVSSVNFFVRSAQVSHCIAYSLNSFSSLWRPASTSLSNLPS